MLCPSWRRSCLLIRLCPSLGLETSLYLERAALVVALYVSAPADVAGQNTFGLTSPVEVSHVECRGAGGLAGVTVKGEIISKGPRIAIIEGASVKGE